MAPFPEITSTKAWKALGVFVVIGLLALGILSVYEGFTQPADEVILGVDDDIMRGIWALVMGAFFAI